MKMLQGKGEKILLIEDEEQMFSPLVICVNLILLGLRITERVRIVLIGSLPRNRHLPNHGIVDIIYSIQKTRNTTSRLGKLHIPWKNVEENYEEEQSADRG